MQNTSLAHVLVLKYQNKRDSAMSQFSIEVLTLCNQGKSERSHLTPPTVRPKPLVILGVIECFLSREQRVTEIITCGQVS